jgi:hypothetical protein
MKPINKDELYNHLSSFLRDRGIELRSGRYSDKIQSSCNLLSDAINLSQKGITTAKTELDKTLDRMRQAVHEKTAPKPKPGSAAQASAAPPPTRGPAPATAAAGNKAKTRAAGKKSAKPTTQAKARSKKGPGR